ncbi:hypothetical protein GIB67_013402 [Kingdonia uniflora]|uniref:ABC transporter C family member 3 n=1 Tax=Kingdonia uniflora TaxID=39325 RepID=A0A7J7LQX0_9MAGN|nr:hypothetical protein GIB67_013402 [Kingdonia uniflora]
MGSFDDLLMFFTDSGLTGTGFYLKPMFLHGVSALMHLVLLFFVSMFWVWKRVDYKSNGCKQGRFIRYYKATLLCSLGLSLFNLAFCCLSYFYWYKSGWSDEKLFGQADLVLRTLGWVVIFAYLHIHFSSSNEVKFPLFLRIWWGVFLIVSCFYLVIDLVLYRKHGFLKTQVWVFDIVSSIAGLFFFYVGLFGKKEREETLLQEPLLNGSRSDSVDVSKKSPGVEIPSPFTNASFFSILSFSWMSPLLAVGNKKIIDLGDVPQLDGHDSVNDIYPIFKNKLDSYSNNISSEVTSFKLVKALLFSTWREILISTFFPLVYALASYVGPYLIDTFVQYLNGRREFKNEGYILVSAFLFAKIVECLCQRHWFFRVQQIGLRARAALVAMVYQKGLTLSSQSRQGHTSGEIINFMTVDAERIGDFTWYMHDLWMVPLQISLALLILYKNLGLASIAGLVATAVVMLANIPLGNWQEKFQKKLMDSKDKRMKSTSEILRNMRILKLQGWEMKFLSKVVELRKNEEGWLKKYVYTMAITTFVFYVAPTFVSVITFGACILMGIPLESGKILSALATFRILQEPIYSLPDTVSMIVQTKVSFDRIASFLRLSDLQLNVIEKLPSRASDVAVQISKGYFSWDPSSPDPTLKDLNLKVFHGMKVAVCGTVGSGKSSLLSCLLGEVTKLSGSIGVSGTRAYVAQSPWIQSMKIEENILFGKEMDRERYERVLEACTLKKDLEILSFGDQTVIGERGINMSGGQKQRIQIARALYQDADIYLFDDPFSAVDAHTGTHLYKVMRDGRITQAGKYDEILSSGTDFMELVGAHKKALSALDSIDEKNGEKIGDTSKSKNVLEKKEDSTTDEIVGQKVQLVQEEEREKGRVDFQVYWKYITTAYKGGLVPLILLAQILFQVLQIGSNYWMAWATPVSKDAKPPVNSSTLIFVYVVLAICSSFCILVRALLLATAGYKTATLLFQKMHLCIFRAPMSFFDATPSGRILNRASTDQSAVDLNIPFMISSVAFTMIQLLGIIAVMSQVAWQQYYIPTARELSRLLGICKAPTIQHFAESISGSTTIRSFDQVSRFMDNNLKLTDDYSRPKFYFAGAMEWLCVRLDMFSSITFAFSLVFLISMPEGVIDPGIAGLAVTYGLNLNMLQAWVIWNLCNLENKIICVERIMQYMCIPSEPPLTIEANKPDVNWPSYGKIDIHDLQVRYAPHMPLVLRGISCNFPAGMKTGIVGRTGSGKSTLIQTLFRIVEPAAGQILIDNINISAIGLHDLRSRLCIIPQDPTMFEGTVRSNLDPLEEYTDEKIWENYDKYFNLAYCCSTIIEMSDLPFVPFSGAMTVYIHVALDRCQLGDEVRKKEGKLDCPVTENGENWSMGQRQLVCLGRVLLKRSQVLVLDEATASVDTATDNLIQQTLRQHFSDCTVITIAHRITSVIDSDMVLLLDHGLIEEYDTPAKLLENKSSSFSKLIAEYTVRSNSSFGSTGFYLKPMFLHGVSALMHLVLLFFVSMFWVWKRVDYKSNGCKQGRFISGWSDEKLFGQADLVLRTLGWVVIFAYLHIHFSSSNEVKFPLFLRIWWGVFLIVSCFYLVIDLVLYRKRGFHKTQVWVFDIVSSIVGLFFFYVGLFGKKEREETLLQEPLLNGSRSDSVDVSKKSRGVEIPSPFTNASFFSILSFSWMSPLLAVGNKKIIDLGDVPQLDGHDSVNDIYPIFKNKLDSYSNSISFEVTSFKLVKALLFSTWREILISTFFPLVYVLASYVGPYLIDTFVQYLNGRREFKNEGYILVSAFLFAKIVECLCQRHWFFRVQQVGLRACAALVAMVYQKGLTLSSQSRKGHASGEIINFMTVDAERIGDFTKYMHDLWMVPLQISLALLILYKNLGLASIAGLVATAVVILAIPLGNWQEKFQKKLMDSKDKRMKSTSEILRNMRILKLQGWEMKFLSKVVELRKNEEGWLKKYVYTMAITTFVFSVAPTFVSVITFGTCILMGIPLESGKFLSALATFSILQEPIYNLPDTVSMIVQTKVSFDRIASFLRLSDLQLNVIENLPSRASDVAVQISKGYFSWDPSSPDPTLKDLNLQVFHGMKVAVCGTVGSGKSSLLSCLLGEVTKLSGSIGVSGTRAYVAQSPWIQSMKIEENILFGKEMDRERYERVLVACTLKKDLEILSFGDQTVIGERGINMSGGQKQRIQIARALYQDADIYLFDDPFSAVDAHTGTHLYKVMRDGRITQAGKYDEILSSGTDFMELVGAHKKALSALDSIDEKNGEKIGDTSKSKNVLEKKEDSTTDEIVGQKAQLVQEEEREKGRVDFQVYWKYITTAYKGGLVPLILLAQILFQVLQIGSNYWMAWATPVSKDAKPPVNSSTLIFVYVVLAICSSFCILVRALLLATAGYKTATLLFQKMHLCIFRAPMSFFDATPSGRILNRASTDQSAVDLNIPFMISSVAFTMIQLLGIIAVMSQVAWQQYYIPTARELSRLLGICKAPTIQHFAESISGSTTIRSFDQVSRFMDNNLKLTDDYSRPKFYFAGAMEWLCVRLDMFSSITFAFSLVFLISMPEGVIDPGIAGLAVTYGLNLNMLQAWVIWNLCNLENKIICVERIMQYLCIPSEPPLTIEANKPDVNWPSYGKIDIHDLQVRYAPHMPLVLRGISCNFPAGMKTGIVGRTGSGKSTLIQTLFRIVEPAAGQILIDNINISAIGLHDLRSRLSIIPQDPTMFEGTVRSNLDPLEEYTDEKIWENYHKYFNLAYCCSTIIEMSDLPFVPFSGAMTVYIHVALDRCQLGDEVRKKEGKLDCPVTENGENWSMGQRQLVCLGRVLLKRSQVLVLDEATASVDTATDNLIQQTLRQHFSDCTVITIAHRITSVIDSDMVLLLDHGLIEEYDTPAKLLENKSSSFSKLIAEYTVRSNSSFGSLSDL